MNAKLGPDDPGLSSYRWRGDASGFFSLVRAKNSDSGGNPLDGAVRGMLLEGEAMLSRKAQLLREVSRVLIATATCIVFSFVVLSLTTVIKCSLPVAVGLLAIGVLLAGACVVLHVRLVLDALKET